MKNTFGNITLFIIFFFSVIILDYNITSASNTDAYKEGEVIAEVRSKILTHYVEEISSQKLLKGALQGMMSVLDQYSEYMDEDTYRKMYERTEGEFIGIGIVISIENEILTIVSPLDGSPAAKAGIRAGDKILAIDGNETEGMTLSDAVRYLKGERGSKVTLKILHKRSKKAKNIIITRDSIRINSIKNVKVIDEQQKIGYFRLTKFNNHTKEELLKTIKTLKSKGTKALIMDLRYNPGGVLDAAIDVVNAFIEKGTIVYTKGRIPGSFKKYEASQGQTFKNIRLIILVNERSASASEIVAGALQDYHRAVIIGTRTYGKGLVQSIMRLRDEKTAIKLTTARYYSPSGRSIQKTKKHRGGIIPDIQVPLTEKEKTQLMDYFYQISSTQKKNFKDRQLSKAISLLKNKSVLHKFK